jgi:hypothetical protein
MPRMARGMGSSRRHADPESRNAKPALRGGSHIRRSRVISSDLNNPEITWSALKSKLILATEPICLNLAASSMGSVNL